MVLCNGAVILDKNKNVIKNNLVDFEAVKKIVEEFADQDKIMIYFDDGNGMKLIENKSVDMKNLYFSEEIEFDLVKKRRDIRFKKWSGNLKHMHLRCLCRKRRRNKEKINRNLW